jgi:hypothetical protein
VRTSTTSGNVAPLTYPIESPPESRTHDDILNSPSEAVSVLKTTARYRHVKQMASLSIVVEQAFTENSY